MPRNTSNDPGAWLPWSVVEQTLKLDLKPASRFRVFLAILATSARYGGRDAKLGVDDVAELTGLSVRTVKSSIAQLVRQGLIVRTARTGRLAVPLLATAKPVAEPRRLFTRSQASATRRALTEAQELLGSDPLDLELSSEWSARLGLPEPVTYRLARESITPDSADVYVGAVLSLHKDERVQGRDL